MDDWLTARAVPAAPAVPAVLAVLVTVALAEGSVPRGAGTRMLVTADGQFDTIGGGHLELRACEIARAMPGDAPARLERFALGPSLGQCCGGVVHLHFEVVGRELAEVLAALRGRRRQDSWRLSAVDGGAASALFDADGRLIAGSPGAPAGLARGGQTRLIQDGAGRRWLLDPCLAPREHLLLFGAGHVGAAIVRLLGELPCTVSWIDERDEMFPASVPANVRVEASDTPEALVAQAPPGASYLVMTHSHALDQRLSEAILARADVGWFGLIGSLTKRAQFERRMLARGLPAERVAAMVCPIGLAGIVNKAPAAIAISVCAQLLAVWEARQASPAVPPAVALNLS